MILIWVSPSAIGCNCTQSTAQSSSTNTVMLRQEGISVKEETNKLNRLDWRINPNLPQV